MNGRHADRRSQTADERSLDQSRRLGRRCITRGYRPAPAAHMDFNDNRDLLDKAYEVSAIRSVR
jgi:hypothetical protein